MIACNICCKRVLNHSYHLKCDLCEAKVHLKCLPCVDKNDALYTQRHGNVFYCSLCLSEIFPYNHLSEEYFDAAITESCEGRPLVSFEILKNQELIFSPFDFNDNSNSPLHDIDPDIQFYNDLYSDSLQPCDYYLEEIFNAKVTKEKVGDQNCSMMHLNIRSVQKNIGTLESYLATLNHKFTIVGISESWLKDHNADRYGLSGYNAIHKYRSTRAGGGVSIFIQDDIEFFCRDDLCYQNDTIETVFIEIDKDNVGKEKNVIIGVIYRPPNTDIAEFNRYMTDTR